MCTGTLVLGYTTSRPPGIEWAAREEDQATSGQEREEDVASASGTLVQYDEQTVRLSCKMFDSSLPAMWNALCVDAPLLTTLPTTTTKRRTHLHYYANHPTPPHVTPAQAHHTPTRYAAALTMRGL